ncbi:MAG: polyprenyl synthetase family protein [Candidatus Aramenus sp.]|nr:polyprenyl synthetase family protein [Candidatus Aramenus sp.]
MDVLEFWAKSKQTIDEIIRGFLADIRDWETLEVSKYILNDGKRFRGTMMLLFNNALGGREEDAYPGALATEILHSASLALDDIVDYDETRRGKKAAWAIYTNRKVIFVSNYLIPTALNIISRYGSKALNISIELWKDTSVGALKDLYGDKSEYIKTVELKTASLFKLPTNIKTVELKTASLFKLPTMLASFSSKREDLVDKLIDLGKHLGIIYQLVDDYVDCVTLDKENLVGSARQLFELTQGKVDPYVSLKVEEHKTEYLKVLDSLPVSPELKDTLYTLPDFLAYGLLSEAGIKNKMF